MSKVRVSTFAVGHCIKPFLPEGIKMFLINVVSEIFVGPAMCNFSH